MSKRIKYLEIWIFLLCITISFHLVRAFRYFFRVEIDWAEAATIWHKLKEFYGGEISSSISPIVIVSIFMMIVVLLFMKDDKSAEGSKRSNEISTDTGE